MKKLKPNIVNPIKAFDKLSLAERQRQRDEFYDLSDFVRESQMIHQQKMTEITRGI